MNHLGTQTLETNRLILRKFQDGDARYIYENWASNDEVTKFLQWQSYTSLDQAYERIEFLKENYKNNNYYDWAIILKDIRYKSAYRKYRMCGFKGKYKCCAYWLLHWKEVVASRNNFRGSCLRN